MIDLMQNFMATFGNIGARHGEKTDTVVTAQLELCIRSMEERLLKLDERTVKSEENVSKQ